MWYDEEEIADLRERLNEVLDEIFESMYAMNREIGRLYQSLGDQDTQENTE